MPGDFPQTLQPLIAALRAELGANLYSCCLYGSAVRGNSIEGVSDINLLIILEDSHPEAHAAIARVLTAHPKVDPFVLGRPGFVRSVRAFAAKFASIRRHYVVLTGEDPLAGLDIPPALERFLCEQALRNLRLRLAYAFIKRSPQRPYRRFLVGSVTPLFLRLSEIVRLEGEELAPDFADRIAGFEKLFALDGRVLRDLLELKRGALTLSDEQWHERVFPLLDKALDWIEEHWPSSPSF